MKFTGIHPASVDVEFDVHMQRILYRLEKLEFIKGVMF
jgi:hypothetical protein